MDALHQTLVTSPSQHRTTLAPRTPETASDEIHLISHIDATETGIEPMATNDMQQFEELKEIAGNKLTGDVMIDRVVMAPGKKIAKGLATTGILLAPMACGVAFGVWGRPLLGAFLPPVLGIPVSLAAAYLGLRGTGALLKRGFLQKGLGSIASAFYEKNMAEPMWTGRREYELVADSTPAIDSKIVAQSDLPVVHNPDDISAFLAKNMKKYQSGLTLVHMCGHGLAYRYSVGLPFGAYEKVLNDATAQAGRAIDVMALESCLESNFEAMAATYPYARYTVCSEETLSVAQMGELFKNTAIASHGRALTPRELASGLVKSAQSDTMTSMMAGTPPSPDTIIALDNEKVPVMVGAVDQLGGLLADEVKDGRTDGIRDAVKGTTKYPAHISTSVMRDRLAIGDLKCFADRVWKIYGGGQVQTQDSRFGFKHVKVQSYPAETQSPRAKDIMAAAVAVEKAMDDAIIAKHTGEGYQDASGISIQLPGRSLTKVENTRRFVRLGATKFEDSAAPAGWRTFVNAMSPRM